MELQTLDWKNLSNEEIKSIRRKEQSVIFYHDVIELGFKRHEANRDQVFFKNHGYDSFIARLKIKHDIFADWCCIKRNVEVYKLVGDRIISKMKIDDYEELKFLLDIIK